MPRSRLPILLAILAALGGVWFVFNGSNKTPLPKMFRAGYTLEQARDKARAEGRLVLAVVTADWCGPCQQYKRSALADKGIASYVADHFVPVMLDADRDNRAAAQLGISSIPATVVLDGERVVARREGVVDATELRAWLDSKQKANP